jgi:hypothetical protein
MSGIFKGLAEYELKVKKATEMYANTAGKNMIADAKPKASWVDRTGLSRQTMDNATEVQGKGVNIILRGNTPQFKYLELANEKKYAVLWPTIQRWQGRVLTGWSNMLSKLR